MFVKLSKNAFSRKRFDYGYIINQMTKWDRAYDDIGCDFLMTITRIPKRVKDIVSNELMPIYSDVEYDQLLSDYMEFVEDLKRNHFVLLGHDEDSLDSQEFEFSYSNGNMKTQTYDYTQNTKSFISENTQDLNMESAQRKPYLAAIQFEITSACNERCIHCYIPNGKKERKESLSVETLKKTIDDFANMGGLLVTLSGGEALLYDKILDIMEYCREKDLIINILSNLIALTDTQIERIKRANVSLVQTSLYSMNPEHHDTITQVKGSFARTKSAIERLVAADIPVQISCPVMKANKNDYKDVLSYAKSINIKAQTDYIMMAQADLDTSNLANRISLDETEELLRDILDFNIEYIESLKKNNTDVDKIKRDFNRFKEQPLCGAGISDCCIAANGDVYPCSGWQGYVIGNILHESIIDIWNKAEKLRQVREIRQKDFPQCLECEALDYCSRCLVRNFNESGGDMFVLPKHACEVAFLNKRLVEEYKAKGLI